MHLVNCFRHDGSFIIGGWVTESTFQDWVREHSHASSEEALERYLACAQGMWDDASSVLWTEWMGDVKVTIQRTN